MKVKDQIELENLSIVKEKLNSKISFYAERINDYKSICVVEPNLLTHIQNEIEVAKIILQQTENQFHKVIAKQHTLLEKEYASSNR